MSPLAERQDAFARALLDPGLAPPAGLAGPPDAVVAERFAVYRNNVAVGLIEALRSAFPVVNRLVGTDFFAAMARTHALACPPSSPVLLAYGGDFPGFIAEFPPAAGLPYLADVARLEWRWLESYHAADATPLALQDLQRLPVERLPQLCLIPHPATRLLRLAHPVLAIWRAHQAQAEPAPMALGDGPEHLLLVRPHAEVAAMPVSPGTFTFLARVQDGATIGEGVAAALAEEPGLAVSGMFSRLFDAGLFCGGEAADKENRA